EPSRTLLAGSGQVLGLASGISFYLGFVPPTFLRRAWQARELRAFLTRAAQLPRLPTTLDIIRELERGAAAATGSNARIGVWDDNDHVLRMWQPTDDSPVDVMPGQVITGRAFQLHLPTSADDPALDQPPNAQPSRAARARAHN